MTPGNNHSNSLLNLPVPAASLLALVLSLVTGAVLLFINSHVQVNKTTLALVFLLPVGISASIWGLIPGVTAAITCFLSFNFFFIPNLFTFQVNNSEDIIALAGFLGIAIVISELTGRARQNLASAITRENEAIRLYEFITVLSGVQSEYVAARIILEKIEQTLLPNRIEILIESPKGPIFFAHGTPVEKLHKIPFVIPLQSVRELIGEIHIWSPSPFSEIEERFLKIFSNQSVLTIERIRLAEEARKTKILEESDRLKSSLLSSVSHELRTPLAAIKASVSSLRTNEVSWESDARIELLTTVEEEIDHLNDLVGNLLDMSRIEAGVLQPQKKPNILREIIAAVSGRIRPLIQNYQLSVDVSDELPLIYLDFVQMQQVFTNLFTNSLKYSPSGSAINISASLSDPEHVLVIFQNNSIPVPNEDLERIFDKFYRIDTSERVTGAGLGLSICKGIIEAHGGSIWAENVVGGLAFKFILPIGSHD